LHKLGLVSFNQSSDSSVSLKALEVLFNTVTGYPDQNVFCCGALRFQKSKKKNIKGPLPPTVGRKKIF